MKLSEELQWRGFVNQTTYEDLTILDGKPITFYWGVDPSADSMTVGNFACAMMVKHFIKAGHKPILLVGGATGMIGDPDGKKNERNLLTVKDIEHNKKSIAKQYNRIFSEKKLPVVDNYTWFKNMNYLTFLREVGKHVPMSKMLNRDFVKTRLEDENSGISYAEFSYSLIQGYDFLHLYKKYKATLQVAGSDQWGNCIAGVDLIRRLTGGEAHIYTAPLIVNKTTGVKFGKSEAGAVWLDAKKTSVYDFYQFWLNADDAGAVDYLKIFTLLTKQEINAIAEEQKQNPAARVAQKQLAFEVTKIVHGKIEAEAVRRVTEILFGGADFKKEIGAKEIATLKKCIPHIKQTGKYISIPEMLVKHGVAESKTKANQLYKDGAYKEFETAVAGMYIFKIGKNKFYTLECSAGNGNIEAYSFDALRDTLTVTFKGDTVQYQYPFSRDEYKDFDAAKYKQKYFDVYIRNRKQLKAEPVIHLANEKK